MPDTQTFTRGGYPLSGDPSMERQMHIGDDKPRCTACGVGIYGDEEYLPNKCPIADDKRHVYPNGEKVPEHIYRYPRLPDDHRAFTGYGLTSSTGQATGGRYLEKSLAVALAGSPVDPDHIEDVHDEAERIWRENVVAPVVRTYLLELLTFEHEIAEFETGNPIRLTSITGRDIRTVGEYEKATLLNDIWVAFPQASLVHLAAHYVPESESGIPDAVAVPAYLAGLTTAEIATRHTDGTLDPDTLGMLTALRS